MQLGTTYVANAHGRRGAQPVPGYRLLHRLGIGGSGEVWSATSPVGAPVALKIMHALGHLSDAEFGSLRRLAAIRHPHVLPIEELWWRDGQLILAMELGEQSLWDRFAEVVDEDEAGLDRDELLEAMAQAAEGIDLLNQPLTGSDGVEFVPGHGAVKPQNLIRVGGLWKVADYGLGPVTQQRLAAQPGHRWHLAYAAPEAIQKLPTTRSDQYSLAVTYCHLRSGRLPFQGDAAALRAAHLLDPPDLSAFDLAERLILQQALAKDAADRWPCCRAFVEALRICRSIRPRALPEDEVEAASSYAATGPATSLPLAPAPPRRRPQPARWRPITAAASLLSLGGLGYVVGDLAIRPGAEAPSLPLTTHVALRPVLPAPIPEDQPTRGAEGPRPDLDAVEETPEAIHPAPFVAEPREVKPEPARPGEPEAVRVPVPAVEPPEIPGVAAAPEATSPAVELPTSSKPDPPIPPPAPSLEAERPAPEESADRISPAEAERPGEVNPPPAQVGRDAQRARSNRQEGEAALARGRIAEAIEALREAVRLDPDDGRSLALLGSAHYRRGDFEAAYDALTRAAELRPADASVRNNRGLASLGMNETAQALADFNRALRLSPDDPSIRYNRALCQARRGEVEAALDDLGAAIRLRPDYARAYQARARLRESHGDRAAARADRRRADQLLGHSRPEPTSDGPPPP